MSIRRQNRQSERAGDELHPLLPPSSNPQLIFAPALSHINQVGETYFPIPPQPAGWWEKIDPAAARLL